MEELTSAQKSTVSKSSSDRLRLLLMRSGYAEEVVLGGSRDQLMSKYAELLVQGWDPAAVVRSVDPELEKARMAHEKEIERQQNELREKELEAQKLQIELREKELAAEAEQRAAHAEQRAADAEQRAADAEHRELRKADLIMQERLEREKMEQQERLEGQKLAFEVDKLQRETGLKTAELNLKEKSQNDEMKVIKRYGDAWAQVLSQQPDEVTDLPSYFRGVEEQFEQLKIPTRYRARLIYRYLSARARALCSRLEPEVREDYVRMKTAIMKEYGLTAKCFLDKFNCLKKSANDTYILFSSKLRGLLLQYLHERKVTKFDELVSLLVSDRLKSSLSDQCLKYVLSIESNLPNDTQQWLHPQRLAEIVDEHVSYVGLANTRASYIGQQQTMHGQGRYQSHWQNKFDSAESGGVNSHKFDRYKPQQRSQSQGKTILDGGALFVSPRRIISRNVTSLETKGSGRLSMSLRPVSNPRVTGT